MNRLPAAALLAALIVGCTNAAERAADSSSSSSLPTISTTPARDTAAVSDVAPQTPADSAVSLIREYYRAINDRRFRNAYMMWSDSGRASGKSLRDYESGFAETSNVTVSTGLPSRIEPAAGSRYITIPVTVTATTRTGEVQHFNGEYDLRRSVVDGATAEQRAWRISAGRLSDAQ